MEGRCVKALFLGKGSIVLVRRRGVARLWLNGYFSNCVSFEDVYITRRRLS